MSVGRILTLGLGTFGGVEFLPTLGYSLGEAVATTVSGVGKHGKTIRLREIEKREDLGEYLKAQLKLKHGDLLPQPVKAIKPKRDKKQDAQVELAMRAMELEQEQERITRSNNDLLVLLMMTEV